MTPSSQSVEVTDTATFYAVVRGVGSDKFTYQWRKGQNNIRNANGPSLMITNIKKKNAGLYRCVVENKNGDTVVSKAVRLSVASKYYSTMYACVHFVILILCKTVRSSFCTVQYNSTVY